MIKIPAEEGDAEDFRKSVEGIVCGVCRAYAPDELMLVRIENWFDRKWVGFSGKLHGSVGIWKQDLTVPPFVPSRVCWQHRYSRAGNSKDYEITLPGPNLHISTKVAAAKNRFLPKVAPGMALVWFSSNSERNEKAALMAYIPVGNEYWVWYAGYRRNGAWKPGQLLGISIDELRGLESSGSPT